MFARKELAMNNLCMGGGGQFGSRDEVALIQTPQSTASWKPVPHIDVINSSGIVEFNSLPFQHIAIRSWIAVLIVIAWIDQLFSMNFLYGHLQRVSPMLFHLLK